jgi:hypothetical protein
LLKRRFRTSTYITLLFDARLHLTLDEKPAAPVLLPETEVDVPPELDAESVELGVGLLDRRPIDRD